MKHEIILGIIAIKKCRCNILAKCVHAYMPSLDNVEPFLTSPKSNRAYTPDLFTISVQLVFCFQPRYRHVLAMSLKHQTTQQEKPIPPKKGNGHIKSASQHSIQHQSPEAKGSEEAAVSWKRSSLYMPHGLVVSVSQPIHHLDH